MSTRTTRIVSIVLGSIVVLALLAWYLRDALIREISNPLLEKYGIEVTDVSLDALATRDVSIAYLELTYEDDTVIAIDGLTLPIIGTKTELKTYAAHRVSIEKANNAEEPLELAPLIDLVLSLNDELAGSEFRITELRFPPYPAANNLHWSLTTDKQDLDVSVNAVSVSASIRRTGSATHTVDLSVPAGNASARLRRDESGFALSSSSDLQLPAWSPLAKLVGIVPAEISVDAGAGRLALEIDVPFDSDSTPTAQVELVPLSRLQLSYAHGSGEVTSVILTEGSPMQIAAVFPAVDWTLQQASSMWQVSYDDWQDIPLALSGVRCRPGPECSMSARVSMENRDLPVGKVGETSLSALVDIVFTDDAVDVALRPDAVLDVHRLDSPDIRASRIEGRLVSPGSLEIVDAGWVLAAGSIDGNVEGLRASDELDVSAPVFLEGVTISELDEMLAVTSEVFVPGFEARWQGRNIALAGVKGGVSLRGNAMQAELETVGLQQDGPLWLTHDLGTGQGSLRLDDAIVSFFSKALSDRVSPWNDRWDLRDGTVAINLVAGWQDSGDVLQGSATASVTGLSGYFDESVFADVSTALEFDYSADGELSVAPARLTAGLLDVGVPITDVSADYVLDPGGSGVAINNLRMAALGGEIRADPFSFYTGNERNTLLLDAESLEMNELLTVKEFEAIEVSGSIGARLPVSIEGDAITITNGTLSGDPAGGVIRYLPGTPPDESDASSLAFVRKVLSNFEYESLSSVVDYTEGGDLKLQLRLEGRNPDMEETRPVVLNLKVENNVPQMLRSLRAARAVEEVLEQRLLQQRDDGK